MVFKGWTIDGFYMGRWLMVFTGGMVDDFYREDG